MSKKQLPEFQPLVAAGNELNALLTPNPRIPTGGITRGKLAQLVSTAAGLLEPTDAISAETAAVFQALGTSFTAKVKAADTPANPPPPDPAKGEEKKDQHSPKQPAKTPKTKPSSEAKKPAPKKEEAKKPPKPPGAYKRGLELICAEPDLEKKAYMERLKEQMGSAFNKSSADIAYGDARRIIRLLRENGLMRKGKPV
jgi:outer membrane biosynthesis protein TonB